MRATPALSLAAALLAGGCAVAPPAASTQRTPAPPSAGTSSSSSSVGTEIVARTNDERRRLGLPSLGASAELARAAQIQAEQMAAARTMSHDLPGAAYPTLASRLAAVSYQARAAGENIAEGYSSASAAVAGWMASPGHRANITSAAYTETGAAMVRASNGGAYFVQVFGTRL
jgi:uncharacterized protein YkwD